MKAIKKMKKFFFHEHEGAQSACIKVSTENETQRNEQEQDNSSLNNVEARANLSASASPSILCFQLKWDIDQMLNLQWMRENCCQTKEEEEEEPLTKFQVCSMAEFLERISNENGDNCIAPTESKQSQLRRYELVDRRKGIKAKKKEEERRSFRGTLLPSHLCSMLEQDIDEPPNIYKIIMNTQT